MQFVHLFQRLHSSDIDLVNRISDSLTKAYDPALSNFFIYQEQCFKSYLRIIIANPSNYLFYVISNLSQKLIGFVFFEIKGDTLSLKNIIIDHEFTGFNIARDLFLESLNIIKGENPYLINLNTEVFEKNAGALKWYKSIGMQEEHHLCWYDITHLFSNAPPAALETNIATEIKTEVDGFGFTQLLYKEQQIGSLVNKRYLVINAELTTSLLQQIREYFKFDKPKSACLISKHSFDLNLIDRSVTLSANFENIRVNRD